MSIPKPIIDGIERLDPLPVTMQRLVAALEDEDVAFQEIVGIVELDQAVASNVLRVANSTAFGGQFRITDLRSAVVRLGLDTLLEIALGDHLRRIAVPAPMYELDENDLWLHGAISGVAVSHIIRDCPEADIPRLAPIAGLVHDIGKLVMVRFLEADAKGLRSLCSEKRIPFVEAEREMLGCDHAEVGAALAEAWSFPAPIVEAIESHHRMPPDGSQPIVDAVVIANLVAKTVGTGLGAEGMNLVVDPECLRRLGLDHTGFCRICAEAATRTAELRDLYQC